LVQEGIDAFRQFRPYILAGLPTLLHVFAQRVRDAGALDILPKLVVPSGEMLLPDTEKLLEDTFKAPVRPYYGCWEFGVVAAWCDLASSHPGTQEFSEKRVEIRVGDFG
jgi:phenylacetate-coenzyme A ligase PaaK-like adenylate-forming protein